MRHTLKLFTVLLLVNLLTAANPDYAQSGRAQDQDSVKVFTEEVRLSVAAFDDKGRPDPTMEIRDLLVLEDGVQQQVRSVRHLPASVLLVLGTSADVDPAFRESTARDVGLNLIGTLPAGDRISIMQFTSRPELLQDWTVEKSQAEQVLRTKLHSGTGSHLAPALIEAAKRFENQSVGNRHIVLVTDGVDIPHRAGYKETMEALSASNSRDQAQELSEAIKSLNAAQATVHVISYTALAREVAKKAKSSPPPPLAQDAANMAVVGIDPTLPPGVYRGGPSAPQAGVGITFDPQMRRLRKAYEKATQRSEKQLSSLTLAMGGVLWLPTTTSELIAHGAKVARDIGTEYVVTYTPKRPLANATPGEFRALEVASRRVGLYVRSRRGYVVSPSANR